MKTILITNDDGINSPGLKAVAEALEGLGEIWTIAPESQRSAAGRSLTSTKPISLNKKAERKYTTSGTPADIVFLARNHLFKKIDLVVSGVNIGANVGIDALLWSGTCGAALEAASFGIPSIAISLEINRAIEATHERPEGHDFIHCKEILRKVSKKILDKGLPKDVSMVTINVPRGTPKGIGVAKLGKVYLRGTVKKLSDDNFFLGGEIDPEPNTGTDIHAMHHGRKIAVTPITLKGFDMNMQPMKKFMEDII